MFKAVPKNPQVSGTAYRKKLLRFGAQIGDEFFDLFGI